MKILVIGGMHGNEPLGIDVVQRFQKNPVKNIDAVFANEHAIKQVSRFTGKDLNRSFPGDKQSNTYEDWRAASLLAATKQYDVVLDFHNTHCPNNDCGFVGETAPAQLYNVSAWLGLNRVIVADYDCINKYAPNCLSVEISLSSSVMDTNYWYEKIVALSKLTAAPKATNIERYKFVYRMTLEDKIRLQLPQQNLKAFTPITKNLATRMDVSSPAYPIFIADKYTPYNYGGLLNKVD